MMMLTVAYFAHKNNWGGDIKFRRPAHGPGAGRTGRRRRLAAGGVLRWCRPGCNAQLVVFVGLALLFGADRFFKWQAVLPIMTPVLLIGGMTTGIFTPTEGAIAASVWAVLLGLFWYRTLSWKMFVKVSLDSVETTATIMFVVAAASIFGWMLTATGVTTAIAQWVLGFTKEAWVFLLLANLLMLFVGCFLEPTAAITILVPILLPIATPARRRPGALRPGDGAEPDDRPAAPADGHGAVRAGARGQAERRAHHRSPSCPGWCRCC